jgi:hypothetical protein
MARAERVFRNLYRDSVSLMQLSAKLGALPGVRQASAVMATASNLALLQEAGLGLGDIEAGPNDLLVAVEGEEGALGDALAAAEAELTRTATAADDGGGRRRLAPRSGSGAGASTPRARSRTRPAWRSRSPMVGGPMRRNRRAAGRRRRRGRRRSGCRPASATSARALQRWDLLLRGAAAAR